MFRLFNVQSYVYDTVTRSIDVNSAWVLDLAFGSTQNKEITLKWGFLPLAVKLMTKSDISFDYRPSATARLVVDSSNQLLPVVAHAK